MLELDHVMCLVPPDGNAPARLEAAGWRLDAGTVHAGQGTRNRRLPWSGQYLELLWIADLDEAQRAPLRLDRRADRARSGASPFGFGFRGSLPPALRDDYWRYDGLPMPVWVHRDDERAPERPLVFVLDFSGLERSLTGRDRGGKPAEPAAGRLRAVRHTGPQPAPLPPYDGPVIESAPGPHRLELTVDGGPAGGRVVVTDWLAVTG
jgi:hypothetical protein